MEELVCKEVLQNVLFHNNLLIGNSVIDCPVITDGSVVFKVHTLGLVALDTTA